MSEKLLEEFNAKLTNESVKKLNNDAIVRLQKLKSIPFKELPRDARYSQQLKVLSSALEYSLLTEDRKEQVEYTRFVSSYDPIMWDLLLEHSPMDSTSYLDLLRKCILTLQDNRREIEAEYDFILLPYRWGGGGGGGGVNSCHST